MAKRRRKIKHRRTLVVLLSVLMGIIFFIGLAAIMLLISSEPSISDVALSGTPMLTNSTVQALLNQTETQNAIYLNLTHAALTVEAGQTLAATLQP